MDERCRYALLLNGAVAFGVGGLNVGDDLTVLSYEFDCAIKAARRRPVRMP